jgi:acyl-coenzyme A synthetase/AMP-(fatty) acid ligase
MTDYIKEPNRESWSIKHKSEMKNVLQEAENGDQLLLCLPRMPEALSLMLSTTGRGGAWM